MSPKRIAALIFITCVLVNSLVHNVFTLPYFHSKVGSFLQDNPILTPTRWIGWDTTWSLFSPVPKSLHWIDWETQDNNGRWTQLAVRNLSPEDRRKRSLIDKLFDVKIAQQQSIMIHSPKARQFYAHALCNRTGAFAARAIMNTSPIPAKSKKHWSPMQLEHINKVPDQHIYVCES